MLELLVLLTWTCLTQHINKNALFNQIFFDKTILTEIASAASLSFCPGLFEVLQAAQPPLVSFFLSLPSKARGLWAIYSITLQKKGCKTLIYTGSGTHSKEGVAHRFRVYDDPVTYREALPELVRRALDDGYKIVHKGILVSCPIPSPGDVPKFRLLFVGVESSMSFGLWTMRSTVKDYGIGSCCPWPRDSFTYGGLCSHNPLLETVRGDFDLSAEQLEAMAAEAKERKRLYLANWHQNEKATNPEGIKAAAAKSRARCKEAYHDKMLVHSRRSKKKAKASRKWYCEVCQIGLESQSRLDRHRTSTRHLKKVKLAKAGVVKKYRCDFCAFTCDKKSDLKVHNKGKRHLARVAAAASSS